MNAQEDNPDAYIQVIKEGCLRHLPMPNYPSAYYHSIYR